MKDPEPRRARAAARDPHQDAAPREGTKDPLAGLTEGRIVHFVFQQPDHSLVHRPAIVVNVADRNEGIIELVWFSAQEDAAAMLSRVYNCRFDLDRGRGSWHWVEPA